MFFSNSFSQYTRSSLWCFLQLHTSCTSQAGIDHKYLHDEHDTNYSCYHPFFHWYHRSTLQLIVRSVVLTEMVLSPKTITLTLMNSFCNLLCIACGCQTNNNWQVVATRYSLIRSVVLIDMVLFPRSIISTLMNFTCICYLYGPGCLNTSDDIIYLHDTNCSCYRPLYSLIP